MIKDLKEFLTRGNVVDLAVAVVIGAAFGAIVSSFVDDLLNPLIGWIFGQPDFSFVRIILDDSTDPVTALNIGAFINAVINFLIIGTALFFVVKVVNRLSRLRQQDIEEEETPEEPSEEVLLLTQIRDALTTRP